MLFPLRFLNICYHFETDTERKTAPSYEVTLWVACRGEPKVAVDVVARCDAQGGLCCVEGHVWAPNTAVALCAMKLLRDSNQRLPLASVVGPLL